MSEQISLQDALEVYLSSRFADLRTVFPAKVISYDKANQTIVARPIVRSPVLSPDLEEQSDEYEELVDIPNVPVAHLRGSETFIHVPLAADDFVYIVCNDLDASEWRIAGNLSNPETAIQHSPNSCYAVHGAFPVNSAFLGSQTLADGITIKSGDLIIQIKTTAMEVGGTADAAALASKVDALQSNLNSLITKYNGHTHLESGATTDPPLVASQQAQSTETFASDKLKIQD